jgi:hypothetical protein
MLDCETVRRKIVFMSPQFRQLEEQALRLPPEDREILADALLHSLDQAPLSDVDEAWVEEAELRYQAWREGTRAASKLS